MASEPKKFMVSWPKIYATSTFKKYAIYAFSPPPPSQGWKKCIFLVAKFFTLPQLSTRTTETTLSINLYIVFEKHIVVTGFHPGLKSPLDL